MSTHGSMCGMTSALLRHTHLCMLLVVEVETKRVSFDFATHFIMPLWSCRLTTLRHTNMESKGGNSYTFKYYSSNLPQWLGAQPQNPHFHGDLIFQIVKVFSIQMKFLELSGYCIVITGTYTFRTTNAFVASSVL